MHSSTPTPPGTVEVPKTMMIVDQEANLVTPKDDHDESSGDHQDPTRESEEKPPLLTFDHDDFPEGGLYGWLNVLAGFWCLFFSFGLANTFGVFEEYYLATVLRHKSSSQVAWIGSFQYGFIFFFGPVVGRLVDAGYLHSVCDSYSQDG